MRLKDNPVIIDGAEGEGGGQVLRTALALSLIERRPLHLKRIRARRKKPGLLRQHLTAVRAAAGIGGAEVVGDALGSSELTFTPKTLTHGDYRFAIGTAGSTMLVLQTVLWPLLCAPGRSRLRLEGGTHNPMAPPFDFFERVLLPLLRRMGAQIEARLLRHGFFPAGGGIVEVELEGAPRWRPLELRERGAIVREEARAVYAHLAPEVADRELGVIQERLGWPDSRLRAEEVESLGPGNALMIEVASESVTELFAGFGEIGVRAEVVGRAVTDEVREYLASGVPVGRHLADQLMMPMTLAGGSTFRTLRPTLHTTTNAAIIGAFVGDRAPVIEREEGGLATISTPA